MARTSANNPAQMLPDDMLADVLGRLPPRSLAVSRCVCTAWRAVIDARRLLRPDLLPLSLDRWRLRQLRVGPGVELRRALLPAFAGDEEGGGGARQQQQQQQLQQLPLLPTPRSHRRSLQRPPPPPRQQLRPQPGHGVADGAAAGVPAACPRGDGGFLAGHVPCLRSHRVVVALRVVSGPPRPFRPQYRGAG